MHALRLRPPALWLALATLLAAPAGAAEPDCESLLRGSLYSAEATGPEHRYSHRFTPGDTVIWDNRCVLHRGAGYDANRFRRYMRQSRVRGAGPTLAE